MNTRRHIPHEGMPPLDESGPTLSFFEFWPMWAFYLPIFIYLMWLMVRYRGVMLPTVANPSFPGGGFFGESKADILTFARRHIPDWVAPFITVKRPILSATQTTELNALTESVLTRLDEAQLFFPVVAKPDLGCRGAGVKLVRDKDELRQYLEAFPSGATLLLQKFIDFEGEAGIFFVRPPLEANGKIISITLKYFPHVTGDGQRTLRELIMADARAGQLSHLYLHRHQTRLDTVLAAGESVRLAFAGSHSRGAIFRNGTHLVTEAMQDRFNTLSKSMPEFYFGRYDIRFAKFSDVQDGHGFTIVEINGAGAESTHIWDRSTGLMKAWRDLIHQYRLLFQIGRTNIERGYTPLTLREFRRWHRREKTLSALYPATD